MVGRNNNPTKTNNTSYDKLPYKMLYFFSSSKMGIIPIYVYHTGYFQINDTINIKAFWN